MKINLRSLLVIALLCLSVSAWAQSPKEDGLKVINLGSAKAHIGFLASDELEGREAGTRGGRIAAEYIVSYLSDIGIEPLGADFLHPFEAYNRERSNRGRFQVHPDSIIKYKNDIHHQKLSMNNILAKIEGKRKDEYVIIGAHYDHLGIDPMLADDKIYNGADDNASGVSAVLQIVKAFLASGVQPERTIIFALWDGEEKGLLGSKHFTQTFPDIDKVKGYLNFDMIGRNSDESNPTHVVYFYTEAHTSFEKWLRDDIKTYNLNLTPAYRPWDRPIGGSDNSSFAILEIPIIWYHTDAHPDYHMPSDHADKLNWDKVLNITKAAYLNMWNLANEEKY